MQNQNLILSASWKQHDLAIISVQNWLYAYMFLHMILWSFFMVRKDISKISYQKIRNLFSWVRVEVERPQILTSYVQIILDCSNKRAN